MKTGEFEQNAFMRTVWYHRVWLPPCLTEPLVPGKIESCIGTRGERSAPHPLGAFAPQVLRNIRNLRNSQTMQRAKIYKIWSILQEEVFAKHVLAVYFLSWCMQGGGCVIGSNWICFGGEGTTCPFGDLPVSLPQRKQVSLHILAVAQAPGWNGRQRCADCLVTTIH